MYNYDDLHEVTTFKLTNYGGIPGCLCYTNAAQLANLKVSVRAEDTEHFINVGYNWCLDANFMEEDVNYDMLITLRD